MADRLALAKRAGFAGTLQPHVSQFYGFAKFVPAWRSAGRLISLASLQLPKGLEPWLAGSPRRLPAGPAGDVLLHFFWMGTAVRLPVDRGGLI